MTDRAPRCRSCGAPLTRTFCDLGMSPPSNAYLTAAQLDRAEQFYPLHPFVCGTCFLVQLEQFQSPAEIFSEYAYFSSMSDSWLAHCKAYAEAEIARLGLGPAHRVIEIASNDGCLLQFFQARGIPVLGIEPAANVAKHAEARGIPSLVRFFGRETAAALVGDGVTADLLVGNNVLAHVPDLNDFIAGLKLLLAPAGVITMEFPHLLRLMADNQFDTIYHEHFSYFSLLSVTAAFARHGLVIFDVDEIPTHGGSLRIHARHAADASPPASDRVAALASKEARAALGVLATYDGFAEQVKETKRALLEFLIGARRAGKRIVGYGAAAKGNTLLNYCGIRGDFLDYVVDRSPHKQGRFLPGTHVQIFAPDQLRVTRPDYVLILPWNIAAEVVEQVGYVREWGARFVVPIPRVTVFA